MSAAAAVGSGVVMAIAMAPSAVFALRLERQLGAGRVGTGLFAAGYLGTWTVIGAAVMVALDRFEIAGGTALTAAAALAAAAYQGSPLARRFLHRCRSPLGLLLTHWRPGALGATRLGGIYAVW